MQNSIKPHKGGNRGTTQVNAEILEDSRREAKGQFREWPYRRVIKSRSGYVPDQSEIAAAQEQSCAKRLNSPAQTLLTHIESESAKGARIDKGLVKYNPTITKIQSTIKIHISSQLRR
jgi:hypothetical protein